MVDPAGKPAAVVFVDVCGIADFTYALSFGAFSHKGILYTFIGIMSILLTSFVARAKAG
ncbi:MAG: hypothetical protein ABSF91_07910 [Bacteroidota bacterium]